MTKFCPSCGNPEVDDNALFCNKCGAPFPRGQPGRVAEARARPPRPASGAGNQSRRKRSGLSGFLSFDTLITGNYLKLIYILGAAGIILFSVAGISGGFAKKGAVPANMSFTNTTAVVQNPASSPLFWIGFLIIGSVLWRMFCELFALPSRIHDAPSPGGSEPYDETAEDEEDAGSGDDRQEQMVECPQCRKIVPLGDLRECEHCGVQGCSNCIRAMGLLKRSMTCRECFENR